MEKDISLVQGQKISKGANEMLEPIKDMNFDYKQEQISIKEHEGEYKIHAYGIAIEDQYGGHWYYHAMMMFCRALAIYGLAIYVDSLLYGECNTVEIKFKNNCSDKTKEQIGQLADKYLYGFTYILNRDRGSHPMAWPGDETFNIEITKNLSDIYDCLGTLKSEIYDIKNSTFKNKQPLEKEINISYESSNSHINNDIELWKDIEEFPGYKISNFGKVSFKGINKEIKKKITYSSKKETNSHLYLKLDKYYNGRLYMPVAKTVLAYFGETKPLNWLSLSVEYIDGDYKNCNITNLKWSTKKRSRSRSGNSVFAFVGDKCEGAFSSLKEAAKKTGVSEFRIQHAIDSDTSFNGYTFKSSIN